MLVFIEGQKEGKCVCGLWNVSGDTDGEEASLEGTVEAIKVMMGSG